MRPQYVSMCHSFKHKSKVWKEPQTLENISNSFHISLALHKRNSKLTQINLLKDTKITPILWNRKKKGASWMVPTGRSQEDLLSTSVKSRKCTFVKYYDQLHQLYIDCFHPLHSQLVILSVRDQSACSQILLPSGFPTCKVCCTLISPLILSFTFRSPLFNMHDDPFI